jgi:hypothetical protein
LQPCVAGPGAMESYHHDLRRVEVSKPENTKENREKLAKFIVMNYTTRQLMEYVIDDLMDDYAENPNIFFADAQLYEFTEDE